ncbi:MAG: hypothetical protein ACK4SY_03035 [Pyrobaculum sp.]
MYRVYLNPGGGRILITKMPIREGGWVLLRRYRKWHKAYREAVHIATELEYVVEWFLEDQLSELRKEPAPSGDICTTPTGRL